MENNNAILRFWNLKSVQCIFWHVLKLLKCLQWDASVAHQNLLDWQSSKTTWFIPIHGKLIIMEVSDWGIEFVSKMYWWTSVRWCFPDQNCIFISARNWIVLQISFEDCSVVGVNTEFYFFFVRWEKNQKGMLFDWSHWEFLLITYQLLSYFISIVLLSFCKKKKK